MSLLISGMQSKVCISATTQRAVTLGYDAIVVADGHSTFDSDEMGAAEIIAKVNCKLSAIAAVVKLTEIH